MTEKHPWQIEEPATPDLEDEAEPVKYNDGYRLAVNAAPILRFGRMPPSEMIYWEDMRREARAQAQRDGLTEFTGPCFYHGDTSMFDAATGACLLCLDANSNLPPAAQYKASMATSYVLDCPKHGPAVHRFGQHGKCQKCFDSLGRARVGNSARAEARNASKPAYRDTCADCGETDFGVASGKCLTCFNTGGMPRSAERGRPGDPVRIAARAAGSTTYLGRCERHGTAEHHTARGKCLLCFNTLGQPRKR